MTTYKVGYLIGSLAKQSINRKLAKALIRLAPETLKFTEISFSDLPLYSYDYDDDYEYREVRPVRRYYAQPRVVYADRYAEPWTRDWYEYCSDRYRSFNARSGTFTGNDGEQHFCTAN